MVVSDDELEAVAPEKTRDITRALRFPERASHAAVFAGVHLCSLGSVLEGVSTARRDDGGVGRLKRRLEGGERKLSDSRARPSLEERSKNELYERAKSLGIDGGSQMNKKDLAAAIRKASS